MLRTVRIACLAATLAGILWIAVSIDGCGGTAVRREPPPPVHASPFADVARVDGSFTPLPGAKADAMAGDWLLRNERLSVVVRGLENPGGFTCSGGNIVDAAPVGGEDLLSELFTNFDGTWPRQAVYERLEPERGPGVRGAVLVARGHDSEDSRVSVETRYSLLPGSDHVTLETRLVNTGNDTLADFELGDVIEWGRSVRFAPGPGRDLAGYKGTVPFLVGAWAGTAYGWIGDSGSLGGPHGAAWSDPVVKTVTLAPGDTAGYTRRLVVVAGPPQNAQRILRGLAADAVAQLQVTVKDAKGHPVSGTGVDAVDGDGAVQGWAETHDDGVALLDLPPGTYRVEASHPFSGVAHAEGIRVQEETTARASLQVAVPAHVRLQAEDEEGNPSPARWIFQGIDTTPDPDFGPAFSLPGSGRCIFTATGEGETGLPPGTYRVTAARGPGFSAETFDLVAGPGKTKTLRARLRRLVPAGWTAADLHVHAAPSADCGVTMPDRARSLACEGVDWFAASDHQRRTDYGPVLDTLALAAPVRAIPSEEVTSEAVGHFSPLPLPLHPDVPGGGPIPVCGKTVDDIFSMIRDENPAALIQINHPRAGVGGYFWHAGDPFPADSTAARPRPRLDFDLMEIMNGKLQSTFEQNWKDWMAILASGRRVVGVGNSDSHWTTGQEAGYPRNYVLLDSTRAGDDAAAVVEALARGRVMATNGPFIEFTLEGRPVGSRVTAGSRGVVNGHIRVIAPSWVDVKRVSVFANGVEEAVFMVQGRERAVRFDEDFDLHLKRSGFVVVRVEGEDPLDPVVPSSDRGPLRPLAFTNPVWVDLAGD